MSILIDRYPNGLVFIQFSDAVDRAPFTLLINVSGGGIRFSANPNTHSLSLRSSSMPFDHPIEQELFHAALEFYDGVTTKDEFAEIVLNIFSRWPRRERVDERRHSPDTSPEVIKADPDPSGTV